MPEEGECCGKCEQVACVQHVDDTDLTLELGQEVLDASGCTAYSCQNVTGSVRFPLLKLCVRMMRNYLCFSTASSATEGACLPVPGGLSRGGGRIGPDWLLSRLQAEISGAE